MATQQNGLTLLNDTDQIARYCGFKKQKADGTPSPAAFLLTDSDFKPHSDMADPRPFVSTNWLEFFHDQNRDIQIKGIIASLKAKNMGIGTTANFAVFNVLEAKIKCQAEDFLIEIKTTGEINDPSHSGIYGLENNNDDIAAILANRVNHDIFPAT